MYTQDEFLHLLLHRCKCRRKRSTQTLLTRLYELLSGTILARLIITKMQKCDVMIAQIAVCNWLQVSKSSSKKGILST